MGRPVTILALVELFQFGGARRVPDHFFGLVGKLAHGLKQFPLTADGGVNVDTGKGGEQDTHPRVGSPLPVGGAGRSGNRDGAGGKPSDGVLVNTIAEYLSLVQ